LHLNVIITETTTGNKTTCIDFNLLTILINCSRTVDCNHAGVILTCLQSYSEVN